MRESAARRTATSSHSADPVSSTELVATFASTSSVRFIDCDRPLVSLLEVLVPSEWDVIAGVYRILHDLRVQVIHARARHADDGASLRYRFYVVEFDGATLHKRRHEELVEAIEGRLRAWKTDHAPARSVVRTRGLRAFERASVDASNDDVA